MLVHTRTGLIANAVASANPLSPVSTTGLIRKSQQGRGGHTTSLKARTADTVLLAIVLASATVNGQNFEPAPADTRDARIPAGAGEGKLQRELRLGGDYLAGRGVPRDPAQAAYWYRKAADQGDPGAQNEIGFFYSIGLGVGADQAEAVKWYERAMAGGCAEAKLNLAVAYLKGTGIRQDARQGIDLLQQLVKKNDPVAEDYLGLVYYLGVGTRSDKVMAEKFFLRAAKQHNAPAEYDMGILYLGEAGHVKDLPKAAALLRSSAKEGYVPAMHALGLLLINQPELTEGDDNALMWLEKAADAGSWRAAVLLGVVTRDGKYGPRDTAAAYRWFSIAVKVGGEPASKLLHNDLAICRKAMDRVTLDAENQRVEAWLAAHPHRDLYVLGNRLLAGNYPAVEVPLLDLT